MHSQTVIRMLPPSEYKEGVSDSAFCQITTAVILVIVVVVVVVVIAV